MDVEDRGEDVFCVEERVSNIRVHITVRYAPWDKGVQRRHETGFTTQLQSSGVV